MSRRATIRTGHEHSELIAAALVPDNTAEMDTRVERTTVGDGERVSLVTTIERETAGGLRTTVDDYVTNLTVAQRLIDYTHNTS